MRSTEAKQSSGKSKRFYQAWLVTGFLQMIALVALNGCAPSAPSPADTLLSNLEPNAEAGEAAQRPAPLPIRISRDFFEKDHLQAEVTLHPDASPQTAQSSVSWETQPTTLPPPDTTHGKVLADFRDYTGCAVLGELNGIRLCFNVMPDVSNLGLNDREMKLQGVENVACSQTDSPSSPDLEAGDASTTLTSSYHLVRAEKNADGSVALEFAPNAAGGCDTGNVQLTLKQV